MATLTFMQHHTPLRDHLTRHALLPYLPRQHRSASRCHRLTDTGNAQPTSRKHIRDHLDIQTPPPPPTYLLVVLPPARSLFFLFFHFTLVIPLPLTHVTVIGHTGQRTYPDRTWNPPDTLCCIVFSFPYSCSTCCFAAGCLALREAEGVLVP